MGVIKRDTRSLDNVSYEGFLMRDCVSMALVVRSSHVHLPS